MLGKFIADFYTTRHGFRPKLEKLAEPRTFVYADQATYAINHNNEHYIFTAGLSTCVGLCLYNTETKIGLIAHFDDNDVSLSINAMLKDLNFVSGQSWQARIIGGQTGFRSSQDIVNKIKTRMQQEQINVLEFDVLGKNSIRDIIMDTADGQLYANGLSVNEYRSVMNQIGLRHLDNIGGRVLRPNN